MGRRRRRYDRDDVWERAAGGCLEIYWRVNDGNGIVQMYEAVFGLSGAELAI